MMQVLYDNRCTFERILPVPGRVPSRADGEVCLAHPFRPKTGGGRSVLQQSLLPVSTRELVRASSTHAGHPHIPPVFDWLPFDPPGVVSNSYVTAAHVFCLIIFDALGSGMLFFSDGVYFPILLDTSPTYFVGCC